MTHGHDAALVTVVGVEGSAPRASGARMLVYADGSIVGTVGGGTWEHKLIEAAVRAIPAGRPVRFQAHLTRDLGMCCGGAMDALIEPLSTQERLHLFGAGHVAHALAPIALALGFEVIVYDDRDDWLTPERFPGCTHVCADPRRRLPALGPRDAVVLVTHSHALDQDLLQSLLPEPFGYLGLIGSRAKVAKFFVRLRAAGMDPALFSKVCAPIGLDLGGREPAEIAVSIAAELVRVRHGHSGPVLPLSENPIQARGGDGRARAPRVSASDAPS